MELINKAAVVAEIKRRISLFKKEKKIEKWSAGASQMNVISLGARIAMLEEVLSFLDTLEVKEVDLDFQMFAKEMDTVFNLPSSETKNTEEEPLNWEYAIAKHFFELGMCANNPITAADRGMVEEIIINLKRVEQDYCINLTKEMEWLRNQVKKGR